MASSLTMLLLGRALAGLFGGSIATAQAVIADVTTPKERAKYLGFLGASIGLGFVFGPAVGAGLSRFGFGTAAFVASGLAAANLLLAFFRLPETRDLGAPTPRSRLAWSDLKDALAHPCVGRILAALFFSVLAFVAMEATFALLGERRFGLGPGGLGLVFTFIGVVIVIVQGGLVGRLTERFGERALAVSGIVIMAGALALLPFMPSPISALAVVGALALGHGLASPAQTSLLSRESNADDQGGILGAGQSLAAAARGVGPIAAGWLFDRAIFLPYLAGAGLMLLAAWLLRGVTLPSESDEPLLAAPVENA
jgi:predicted MFS family arabinose efflux permease